MPRRPPFDAIADSYDRVRPGYPDPAVDDLVAFAALPARGRVLEIGAGTGQLSVTLAERGYQITAVEVGPALADRLRANLAEYRDADVVNADFHALELPPASYDLVVAATSFHWLDRERAYREAAEVLRPTGALGLLFNVHANRHEGFFAESEEVYRRHVPELLEHGTSVQGFQEIDWAGEIAATGRFEPARVAGHRWAVTYRRADWLELQLTHSDHLALDADRRERLFADLAELMDRRFHGEVEQVYETLVAVARVRSDRER